MTDYNDLIENTQSDVFDTLYGVNVNEFTEKKGKFTYISWAHALAEVKKRYPNISWSVSKFIEKSAMYVDDKLVQTERTVPYMRDSQGYTMVEVEVTIDEITLPEVFPVLDYRNKAVQNPDSFQVNTAIKRALTKCYANFGLGLYIYAGEDLTQIESRLDGSTVKEGEGTIAQYVKLDRLVRSKHFSDEETQIYKTWMFPTSKEYPSEEQCNEQIKNLDSIIKGRKADAIRSNNK